MSLLTLDLPRDGLSLEPLLDSAPSGADHLNNLGFVEPYVGSRVETLPSGLTVYCWAGATAIQGEFPVFTAVKNPHQELVWSDWYFGAARAADIEAASNRLDAVVDAAEYSYTGSSSRCYGFARALDGLVHYISVK
ncbi:MAG: hypothetical protein ABI221_01265 [Candidatus Saccharimonadales bacterium]